MKFLLMLLCACAGTLAVAEDYKFRCNLPIRADANKLTPEMFKGADAVIIHKEQWFVEGPHTRSIFVLTSEVTIEEKIVIAKLFNEQAVKDFGSFEYEYREQPTKEERHTFKVHARVMKPDSTVWVMPDSAVSVVTGTATGRGRALTKKVLFKLQSLAPGDVVQIEYTHAVPYSFMRQVLFFYHDRYPILTSAVCVDMDKHEEVDYLHFPAEKIVAARSKERTYTYSNAWTSSNLAAIPKEPFARPFADVSYMTAIINHPDEDDPTGWRAVARKYLERYIEKGSVPTSFIRSLGFDPSTANPQWSSVDSLYTALAKYFHLARDNENYPSNTQVDDIIDSKRADASDLGFIMLKILERWGVSVTPVLIRDRRQGVYEPTVSSSVWFDRMSVLVSLQNGEKVYDFDRCIPSTFQDPWFLNGTTILALHDTGATHLVFKSNSNWRQHISGESHVLAVADDGVLRDSLLFVYRGAHAQRLRGDYYALTGSEMTKQVSSVLEANALEHVDSCFINKFRDEKDVRLSGRGTSRAPISRIDSFMIVQPRNELLRTLRQKFSSTERYDDIFFDEQFAYMMDWTVKVPAGYTPSGQPDPITVQGVKGTSMEIIYYVQDDVVTVKANVLVTTENIGADQYKKWLTFLDEANKALEREITFKRKAN